MKIKIARMVFLLILSINSNLLAENYHFLNLKESQFSNFNNNRINSYNLKSVEISKKNRNTFNNSHLFKNRGKVFFQSGLSFLGEELADQLYQMYDDGEISINNFDYVSVGSSFMLGGASGLTIGITEDFLKIMLKDNKIFKFLMHLDKASGKLISSFFGNITETVFYSYGRYFLGRCDFEEANRFFIAGTIRYTSVAVMTASIGWIIGFPTSFVGQSVSFLTGFGIGFVIEESVMHMFNQCDIKKYHENEQIKIERMLDDCLNYNCNLLLLE